MHATTLPLFTTSGVTERGDLTGAAWIVIGLATGRLSGLLGIGGGVVMVPAMIIGLGMFPVAPATKHAQSDRWMD